MEPKNWANRQVAKGVRGRIDGGSTTLVASVQGGIEGGARVSLWSGKDIHVMGTRHADPAANHHRPAS